jgi:Ca2+-transporting ATPase
MTAAVEGMAIRGIRVLAVATATPPNRDWAETQHDYDYTLAGLVGLADPIRASVPAAVAECRGAGIRVVMITGDYAATARSIATQAGIAEGGVLTGTDLASLDDAQLAERLKTVTVFARIMPEQKLRIVQAFKADGEIVAMTGDGVNDAPSLKAAHIGIAMGKRGTDVAREASAMVLLEDDFGSIVQSVRLGRRIYDNIRKAMAFIFAVHVPIAGLALLPLFFGLPILFGPIHIALLEMVIDPVCALVFEAERDEDDIMRRLPRDPSETLFSLPMIVWSVFQGGLAFAMLATVFLIETWSEMPEIELRALTFFALIAEIVALILVNRSFNASLREALVRQNAALRYVAAAITGVTALILFLPQAQALLKFGSIAWRDMALAVGLGIILLGLLEGCKPLVRRLTARVSPIHVRSGIVAS